MKIIVTKEDLDQVERPVRRGLREVEYCEKSAATLELWKKIRLCFELGLEMEYQEEYTESEESMGVEMITEVNGVEKNR